VPEVVVVAIVGSLTALATGLGVVPVVVLGARAERLRPFLWGVTIGVMTIAALAGLLRPALDLGRPGVVVAGLAVGIVFLFGARRWLRVRERQWSRMVDIGVRRSVLVFAVLFVHSLPEGFALGTAWASDQDGLGFFVFLAIALQNIPEGTSVSIPMEAAGFGRVEQFWAAVATSLPQPVGAVVAFLLVDFAQALLPFSLAFAASAMLALVGIELLPQAVAARRYLAVAAGAGLGGMTMLAVAALLGV